MTGPVHKLTNMELSGGAAASAHPASDTLIEATKGEFAKIQNTTAYKALITKCNGLPIKLSFDTICVRFSTPGSTKTYDLSALASRADPREADIILKASQKMLEIAQGILTSVASLPQPSVAPLAPPPPMPIPVASPPQLPLQNVQDLAAEVDALKAKYEIAVGRNFSLAAKLTRAEEKATQDAAEIADLKQQLAASESEVTRLRQETGSLQSQLATARSELGQLSGVLVAEKAANAQLRDQLARLRKERGALLAQQAASTERIADLERHLHEKTSLADELGGKFEMVSALLATSEGSIRDLTSQLSTSMTLVATLQDEIQSRGDMLANLRVELSGTQRTNSSLQTRVAALEAELASLREKFNGANENNRRLEGELSTEKRKSEGLVREQETALTQFETALEISSPAAGTHGTARLRAIHTKLTSLKREVDELRVALPEAREANAMLQRRLDENAQQLSASQAEVASLRSQLKSSEARVSQVEAQLANQSRLNSELNNQYDTALIALEGIFPPDTGGPGDRLDHILGKARETTAQVAQLEAIKAELNAKLLRARDALAMQTDMSNSLESQIETLTRAKATVDRLLEEERTKSANILTQVKVVLGIADASGEVNLDTIFAKLSEIRAELLRSTADVKRLTTALAAAQEETAALQRTFDEKNIALSTSQGKIGILEGELSDLQKIQLTNQQRIAELEKAYGESATAFQVELAARKSIEAELAIKGAQVFALEEAAKKKDTAQSDEIKRLSAALSAKEAANAELLANLAMMADMEARLTSAEKGNEALEAELAELRKLIPDLEAALAKANDSYKEANAALEIELEKQKRRANAAEGKLRALLDVLGPQESRKDVIVIVSRLMNDYKRSLASIKDMESRLFELDKGIRSEQTEARNKYMQSLAKKRKKLNALSTQLNEALAKQNEFEKLAELDLLRATQALEKLGVSHISPDLSKAPELIEQLENMAFLARKEANDLKVSLESSLTLQQRAETKISELTRDLREKIDSYETLVSAHRTNEKELKTLQKTLKLEQARYRELELSTDRKIHELSVENESNKLIIEKLQNRIAELNQENTKLELSIGDLESIIEIKNNKIEALQEENKELNESLIIAFQATQALATSLGVDTKDLGDEVTALSEALNDIEEGEGKTPAEKVRSLLAQLAEARRAREELESSLAQQTALVREARSQLISVQGAYEKETESLKAQLAAAAVREKDLQAALCAQCAVAKEAISELAVTNLSLTQTQEALRDVKAELATTQASNHEQITALTGAKKQLEMRVLSLGGELAVKLSVETELRTLNLKLEERAQAAEERVAALTKALDATNLQLKTSEASTLQLNGALKKAAAKLEEDKVEIEALKREVSTLRGRVTELEASEGSYIEKIRELEARIATLKAREPLPRDICLLGGTTIAPEVIQVIPFEDLSIIGDPSSLAVSEPAPSGAAKELVDFIKSLKSAQEALPEVNRVPKFASDAEKFHFLAEQWLLTGKIKFYQVAGDPSQACFTLPDEIIAITTKEERERYGISTVILEVPAKKAAESDESDSTEASVSSDETGAAASKFTAASDLTGKTRRILDEKSTLETPKGFVRKKATYVMRIGASSGPRDPSTFLGYLYNIYLEDMRRDFALYSPSTTDPTKLDAAQRQRGNLDGSITSFIHDHCEAINRSRKTHELAAKKKHRNRIAELQAARDVHEALLAVPARATEAKNQIALINQEIDQLTMVNINQLMANELGSASRPICRDLLIYRSVLPYRRDLQLLFDGFRAILEDIPVIVPKTKKAASSDAAVGGSGATGRPPGSSPLKVLKKK